jgi:hypothetical protein
LRARPHELQRLEQRTELPVVRDDIVRSLNEALDARELGADGFGWMAVGRRILDARFTFILFFELARERYMVVRVTAKLAS